MIKHKYFTCCCGTEKCRYNKSSIYGFLKEYYLRIGEPMPEDLVASARRAAPSAVAPMAALKDPSVAANVAVAGSGSAQGDTKEDGEAAIRANDGAPIPVMDSKGSGKKDSSAKREGAAEKKTVASSNDAAAAEASKKKAAVLEAVVIKKEAVDDASSEDGQQDRKVGGRPRRAVTKKAAEEATK